MSDHHAMSLTQATFGDTNGPIRCRLFPVVHLPAQLTSSLPLCTPTTSAALTTHFATWITQTTQRPREAEEDRW